jgi:hypothetical protein
MPVKLRAKPHPAKGRNRSLARARAGATDGKPKRARHGEDAVPRVETT